MKTEVLGSGALESPLGHLVEVVQTVAVVAEAEVARLGVESA